MAKTKAEFSATDRVIHCFDRSGSEIEKLGKNKPYDFIKLLTMRKGALSVGSVTLSSARRESIA